MQKSCAERAKNLRRWLKKIPYAEINNVKALIVDQCMLTATRWEGIFYGRTYPSPLEQSIINKIALDTTGDIVYSNIEKSSDEAEGASGSADDSSNYVPGSFFCFEEMVGNRTVKVSRLGDHIILKVSSTVALPRQVGARIADRIESTGIVEFDSLVQSRGQCTLCGGVRVDIAKEALSEVIINEAFAAFAME